MAWEEHMYSWRSLIIKTSSGKSQQHGMLGYLNLNVSGDSLSKSIALRNKAGLDTLELDEEIISNSKKIDVSRFENIRIRGFLREVFHLVEQLLTK